MIQIKSLSKRYNRLGKSDSNMVLSNITTEIDYGEIVAFIGKNGCGKSTLLKCISGLLCPTKGSVFVNGKDAFKSRRSLSKYYGVMIGEKSAFIEDVSVEKNFDLFKVLYDIDKSEFNKQVTVLDSFFDIMELFSQEYRRLSYGQRKRCEIASILIHNPSLIILDEPTNGLDFYYANQLKQCLHYYNSTYGSTVILTNHDLSFFQSLAQRVIYLQGGEVVFDGDYEVFMQNITSSNRMVVHYNHLSSNQLDLSLRNGAISYTVDDHKKVITIDLDKDMVNDVIKELVNNHIEIIKLEVIPTYEFYQTGDAL